MWVGFQRQQTFLVTTERALWRHDNAFLFTSQSEVDFGNALVLAYYFLERLLIYWVNQIAGFTHAGRRLLL